MIYEMGISILNTSEFYDIVHCISNDFRISSRGLDRRIEEEFGISENLIGVYGKLKHRVGDVLVTKRDNRRVLSLISKERSEDKSDLKSIEECLINLRNLCESNEIKALALPRIGCGFDGLEWEDVFSLINENFRNSDIEVLICSYKSIPTITDGYFIRETLRKEEFGTLENFESIDIDSLKDSLNSNEISENSSKETFRKESFDKEDLSEAEVALKEFEEFMKRQELEERLANKGSKGFKKNGKRYYTNLRRKR